MPVKVKATPVKAKKALPVALPVVVKSGGTKWKVSKLCQ